MPPPANFSAVAMAQGVGSSTTRSAPHCAAISARVNFSAQVAAELRGYFGERVLETVIPRNVRLAEAPSHGRPITEYDNRSKGALAYMAAAGEFLRSEEERYGR